MTAYREAQNPSEEDESSDTEDDPRESTSPTFLQRWIEDARKNPTHPRLIGKSGMYSLIQSAFEMKSVHNGAPMDFFKEVRKLSQKRPDIWNHQSVRHSNKNIYNMLMHSDSLKSERYKAWRLLQ